MLTTEEKDGVIVLTIDEPRLDAATTPTFRTEALPSISGGGRVVLDASKLEFVDSTGLGALVSLLKAIGPSGTFVLVGAGKQMQKLLSVTRLDRVFTMEDTVEAALQRMK